METGTFRGDSTLLLTRLVPRVWTVELDADLYVRAKERLRHVGGVTVLHGSSASVLPELLPTVREPALFWLDGHGGMVGIDDVPDGFGQCPLMDEIAAIDSFEFASDSVVLIDDARAFFGPATHQRREDWPTFMEVADALRRNVDRHVTVLDDVIIAVPVRVRDAVDGWWSDQLQARRGGDALQQAMNPSPGVAARRLVRSLTPRPVLDSYRQHRRRSG